MYLLTALAITVQAMVYGQTPANQANTLKVRPVIGTFNPKTQSATVSYKEFSFKSGEESTEQTVQIKTSPLSGYNKSLQIKGSVKDVKELLEQAEEMKGIEQQIRKKASQLCGTEKNKLIEVANGLARQIEHVQIQASEINGRINLETFEFNKEVYELVLQSYNGTHYAFAVSEELSLEAEQNFKLAKEMRQEAYAMPSNSGKLGTLMNAEEKEAVALNKQAQAIEALKKSNSNSIIAVK